MTRTRSWVGELKQTREELRLKMHLGSMEAREQWEGLEGKWREFAAKARLAETGEEVEGSLRELGLDLKAGYERIKAALAPVDV
jgi:hypothetical protein